LGVEHLANIESLRVLELRLAATHGFFIPEFDNYMSKMTQLNELLLDLDPLMCSFQAKWVMGLSATLKLWRCHTPTDIPGLMKKGDLADGYAEYSVM